MNEWIKLANGTVVEARFLRQYGAYEGGQRYIFLTLDGECRCVKDEDGNYVEYRP